MTWSRRSRPLSERFWEKVDKRGPDECWPWISPSKYQFGYGVITRGAGLGSTAAHRVAWELEHGPISPGMIICHRCDNPPCCNPAHLFVGTQADNVHDMLAKGRARTGPRSPEWRAAISAGIRRASPPKTHCPHGHEYTADNILLNNKGAKICRACGCARKRDARLARKQSVMRPHFSSAASAVSTH